MNLIYILIFFIFSFECLENVSSWTTNISPFLKKYQLGFTFRPNQRPISAYKVVHRNKLSSLSSINIEKSSIFPLNDVKDASMTPPYTLSTPQFLYVVLTSVFISSLIVADIVGVKIFEIPLPFPIFGCKNVEHTCGMLTFPLTFLLSDIITEYYGPETTKKTVYLGFFMSIMVCAVINIAQVLPYLNKPFNVSPAAFNMVFGSAKLLYVASLCAYLMGQFMDIWLFGVIKRWTKGKYLWLRAIASTVISQLLDSFAVSFIAFRWGKMLTNQIPATIEDVISISVTGYGLKFFMAAALTPLLYALKYVLESIYNLKPAPVDYSENKNKI